MRKTYEALGADALAQLGPNVSYTVIAEMVGTGKTVLDVGCGPGNLAAILKQRGCEVTGLDADPAALRAADRHCAATIQVDLDATALADVVGDRRFDAVVFADVLEHLSDPVPLLASARAVLAPGGFVVASIPNIAHAAVRLALMRGRFEYQRLGILDQTHVRFFTLESVERLVNESGYVIGGTSRTTAPVFGESDLVPLVRREDYEAALVDEVLADAEAETLQFVVRGYPLEDDDLVMRLRSDIVSLEQTVRTLQALLAQQTATRAGAAAPNPDLESRYRTAVHDIDGLRRQLANKDAIARSERDRLGAQIDRLSSQAEQLRGALASAESERARLAAEAAESTRRQDAARAHQLAQISTDLAVRDEEIERLQTELATVSAQFARLVSAYKESSAQLTLAEVERERFAERLSRAYSLLEVREASARDQNEAADRMMSALERRRRTDRLTEALALTVRAAARARIEQRFGIIEPRSGIASHAPEEPGDCALPPLPVTELIVADQPPPVGPKPLRSRLGAAVRRIFSP